MADLLRHVNGVTGSFCANPGLSSQSRKHDAASCVATTPVDKEKRPLVEDQGPLREELATDLPRRLDQNEYFAPIVKNLKSEASV